MLSCPVLVVQLDMLKSEVFFVIQTSFYDQLHYSDPIKSNIIINA